MLVVGHGLKHTHSLIALDPKTGARLWKTTYPGGFPFGVMQKVDGKPNLVVCAGGIQNTNDNCAAHQYDNTTSIFSRMFRPLNLKQSDAAVNSSAMSLPVTDAMANDANDEQTQTEEEKKKATAEAENSGSKVAIDFFITLHQR